MKVFVVFTIFSYLHQENTSATVKNDLKYSSLNLMFLIFHQKDISGFGFHKYHKRILRLTKTKILINSFYNNLPNVF